MHRGRTQRHAVGAKVRVFVRNPDELANERAELARLLNKAGTCFLHGTSLSTASGCSHSCAEVWMSFSEVGAVGGVLTAFSLNTLPTLTKNKDFNFITRPHRNYYKKLNY